MKVIDNRTSVNKTPVEKKTKKKSAAALKREELEREYETLFDKLCENLNSSQQSFVFWFEKYIYDTGIHSTIALKHVRNNNVSYLRYGGFMWTHEVKTYLSSYKRLFMELFSGNVLNVWSCYEKGDKYPDGNGCLLKIVDTKSVSHTFSISFPRYSSLYECLIGMNLLGWNLQSQ